MYFGRDKALTIPPWFHKVYVGDRGNIQGELRKKLGFNDLEWSLRWKFENGLGWNRQVELAFKPHLRNVLPAPHLSY